MKQSILLDLDDTFLNSKHVLAEAIHAEHGIYCHPDTWTTYRLSTFYPTLTQEDITSAFVNQNVFGKMTLAEGSFDLWRYCQQRDIRIEFVTSRGFDPDAYNRTTKSLYYLLGGAVEEKDYTLTIVKHGENKHEKFTSERPILYVDDACSQVHGMREHRPDITSLLMVQAHNKTYRDEWGPATVTSMHDVIDILQYLRGQRMSFSLPPFRMPRNVSNQD